MALSELGVQGRESPFFYQFLNCALGGTVGEVSYVEVMGSNFNKPLPPYINDCANVVLRGQYELMVQYPFRLVRQAGTWVQANHLVVFARKVMPTAIHMSNLHEKTSSDRLANVGIVVPRLELRGHHLKVVALHEASKLLAHAVRAFEAAAIQEIIPGPLGRIVVALPSVVPASHRHVVQK